MKWYILQEGSDKIVFARGDEMFAAAFHGTVSGTMEERRNKLVAILAILNGENAQNSKETPSNGLVWNADKTAAYFGEPWNKGEKPMFCVTGDKKEVGISWPFNCDELHFSKEEALALAEAINHFMGEPKEMAFSVNLEDAREASKLMTNGKHPSLAFMAGVKWMLDQIHSKKP